MSPLKMSALALLALSLGACQSLFQPSHDKPLTTEREAWEHIKPGCTTADCPLVNLDTVHFPDEPALDTLVQQRLLHMTQDDPDLPPVASLPAYEQQFLGRAQAGNATYLQAKVREQHDGLVIVELSSYLDTGGAHGMPGRGFITWSREQHKALTLADMVVPGQEATFWLAAQEAHRGWLIASKLDQDAEFVKNWPFQRTENIALASDAVVLKYNVYSIAPYAMGHIELKIPYARLNGVIRPELRPGR
jgi:hypothetical protein